MGCVEKSDEIKEKTLSAVNSAQTYSFDTTILVKTSGVVQEIPVAITESIHGSGAVDNVNKKMFFDVSMNSTSPQSVGSSSQEMKVYLIGDVAYFTSQGSTVTEKVSDSEIIWSDRTHIKQQAKILSESKARVLSQEEVGGVPAYVLQLTPDKEELVRYIAEQSSVAGAPLAVSDSQVANLSGMVEDFSIVLWVGKEDYLPRKFKLYMSLKSGQLSRDTTIVMYMWDYGKPVEIALPERS